MNKRGIGGGISSGSGDGPGSVSGSSLIHLGEPLPLPYKIASVDEDETAVDSTPRTTHKIRPVIKEEKPRPESGLRSIPRRTLELRKPHVDGHTVLNNRLVSGDRSLEVGKESAYLDRTIRRPLSESKPQVNVDQCEEVPKNAFPRKRYDLSVKPEIIDSNPARDSSGRHKELEQGSDKPHRDEVLALEDDGSESRDITLSQISESAQELITSIDHDLNKLHLLVINNRDIIEDLTSLESIKMQVEKTIGASITNRSRDTHHPTAPAPTIFDELERLQQLDNKTKKYRISLDYRYAIICTALLIFLTSSFAVSGLNYEYCYYFC